MFECFEDIHYHNNNAIVNSSNLLKLYINLKLKLG